MILVRLLFLVPFTVKNCCLFKILTAHNRPTPPLPKRRGLCSFAWKELENVGKLIYKIEWISCSTCWVTVTNEESTGSTINMIGTITAHQSQKICYSTFIVLLRRLAWETLCFTWVFLVHSIPFIFLVQ